MNLEMIVATLFQPRWSECVNSWQDTAIGYIPVRIVPNLTIIHAYQIGAMESTAHILGYCHDDLLIREAAWDERVATAFNNQDVVIAGFAGALGHGHPDLYKGEYHLPNLARQHFRSNLRNAEQHGERFSGSCDVAVLDGLALFVRASFLREIGGWPQDGSYGYFLYSEYLCCTARRHGKRIRLVGIDCDHLGGKSSGLKQDQVFDYEGEHRRLYEQFKDVLPAKVNP